MKMEYIGYLVLLSTIIITGYCLLKTKVDLKRVIGFASLSAFVGFGIIFRDRATNIGIPGIGNITMAVGRANAGAEQVEGIKKEVESHRDSIVMVVRDANKSREDIDRIGVMSNEAKTKADQIDEALKKAEAALVDIQTISIFSTALASVKNDDRLAFDALIDIVGMKREPFSVVALKALLNIVEEFEKTDVSDLYKYEIYWDKTGLDPIKTSLEDFMEICKSAQPWGGRFTWIPTVLETVWGQERFPKAERLQFLFDVIKTTKSLRVLRKACQLLDQEAKLGINVIGYKAYIEWWEKNKDSFKDK